MSSIPLPMTMVSGGVAAAAAAPSKRTIKSAARAPRGEVTKRIVRASVPASQPVDARRERLDRRSRRPIVLPNAQEPAWKMQIRDRFLETIGKTPLIRLRRASELTGCTIMGKAEFLNPGGSVKDRAALFIVRDAEARGLLQPGGVIVEGTAGNTGIGLALVGNALGYRTVIVMPDTQSQEKKDMLRLCGADLRLVPAAPYTNPNNYVRYSGRLAEEIAAVEPNGAIW